MFGSFSVASVFVSKGFGLADELSKIRSIESHQFIIGSVPAVPNEYRGDFQIIQQNTDFVSDQDDTLIRKNPIVAICQFQNNCIINTSMAGGLLLPLMKAIDLKLSEQLSLAKGKEEISINATLLDSYNWCDSCLILRGNNFEMISECIHSIRKISFKDIYDAWEQLEKGPEDRIAQIGKHSFNRIDRVLNSLLKNSNYDYDGNYNAAKSNNHVLLHTLSFLGVFDPFVREFTGKAVTKPNKTAWQINGDSFAHTSLRIRPGHENKVLSQLADFFEEFRI